MIGNDHIAHDQSDDTPTYHKAEVIKYFLNAFFVIVTIQKKADAKSKINDPYCFRDKNR